jgi:hypothetical protein
MLSSRAFVAAALAALAIVGVVLLASPAVSSGAVELDSFDDPGEHQLASSVPFPATSTVPLGERGPGGFVRHPSQHWASLPHSPNIACRHTPLPSFLGSLPQSHVPLRYPDLCQPPPRTCCSCGSVSRGIYAPFKVQIKRNPNNRFISNHVRDAMFSLSHVTPLLSRRPPLLLLLLQLLQHCRRSCSSPSSPNFLCSPSLPQPYPTASTAGSLGGNVQPTGLAQECKGGSRCSRQQKKAGRNLGKPKHFSVKYDSYS